MQSSVTSRGPTHACHFKRPYTCLSLHGALHMPVTSRGPTHVYLSCAFSSDFSFGLKLTALAAQRTEYVFYIQPTVISLPFSPTHPVSVPCTLFVWDDQYTVNSFKFVHITNRILDSSSISSLTYVTVINFIPDAHKPSCGCFLLYAG
ncbi:hypothetical protein BsWGS_13461 [Bradybaena similaris]